MKHKVRHIHFVGIGGSGMSGIAEVLLNLGYQVSGSDLAENAATRRLRELGARVNLEHAAAHINGAERLTTSGTEPNRLRGAATALDLVDGLEFVSLPGHADFTLFGRPRQAGTVASP